MSSDDENDLERGLIFRLHGSTTQPAAAEQEEMMMMMNNNHHNQSPRAGVFRINTAVSGFRRLVNTIGTPKDNLQLRQKLHNTRLQIGQLVKETSAKLKPVTDNHDQNHPVLKTYFQLQPVDEIANAKLAKDLQSVLREFEKAHLIAAEKEAECDSEEDTIVLENEFDLHESIFEERDQGIKEIRQQMNEVNEIFGDLADLVHEQGITIEGIAPNTEICNTAITQATSELGKASRNHNSQSSMTCLLLVIFGVILLIVLILITA